MARYYDYNFNAMIYYDYYRSYCLSVGSLLSPCERFLWSCEEKQKLIPKPPIMLNQDDLAFDHSNELTTVTLGNEIVIEFVNYCLRQKVILSKAL